MTNQQALIAVLKNIKGRGDTQIAFLGTQVFLRTLSFDKAKEHCMKLRVTLPLSELLTKK
jgi:hypothetical protein